MAIIALLFIIMFHMILMMSLSTVIASLPITSATAAVVTTTTLHDRPQKGYGGRRLEEDEEEEHYDHKEHSVSMLNSLRKYDDVRVQSEKVMIRKGAVDVLDLDNDNGTEIAFCHLPTFIPIKSKKAAEDGEATPIEQQRRISDIGAVALALEHLNTGNGTIIREIEGLDQRCNVRFTFEVADTESSTKVAVNKIISYLYPTTTTATATATPTATINEKEAPPKKKQSSTVCGFIGEYRSDATIPMSIISSFNKYPIFSPVSTSSELNDHKRFDHFGRLITSDIDTAEALLSYLYDYLDVKQFMVLHTDDSYGSRYVSGLREVASIIDPEQDEIRIFNYGIPPDILTKKNKNDLISSQIKAMAKLKLNYIIGIFEWDIAEFVMEEALRQGIAGDGSMHQWIFGDAMQTAPYWLQENHDLNLPLMQAMTGVGIISFSSTKSPLYDTFVSALNDLDNEYDMEYLKATSSSFDDNNNNNTDNDDNLVNIINKLSLEEPTFISPIMYDTAIAYGLGACKAAAATTTYSSENDNGNKNKEYFTGTELYNAMLQTEFEGVTGYVRLDNTTGTRDPYTATYTISNAVVVKSTNSLSLQETNVFQKPKWTDINDAFVYSDGTTTQPKSFSMLNVDKNHINPALQAVAISAGVLIVILSIILSIWTMLNKDSAVIKASQPIFLNCLLCGICFMGASLIPLSIDDRIVESMEGCSIACTAFPWFLCLGLTLAFTALLTKTHRINRILNQPNFRRVTVTPFHVMRTMVLILSVNVLILSLWTGLTPHEWTRTITKYDDFKRPKESVGECAYRDGGLPYIISLAVVNVGTLLLTMFEAYRARNISTDFQESDYIMKAVVCMALVCFIGLPIAIMSDESSTRHFAETVIIIVTCMSLLGFIFGPKIYFHYKKKLNKSTVTNSRSNVHVGSICGAQPSRGFLAVHRKSCMKLVTEENKQLRAMLEANSLEAASLRSNTDKIPCDP